MRDEREPLLPAAECNHELSSTCPVCTHVIRTADAERFDVQLIPEDDGDD